MQPKLTRSEQKRMAILNAAKVAFQEDGYQGTSMDRIAALAEVSKRTVYNHFESKEALIMQLMADLWQQAVQPEDARFDTERSLQDQLTALLEDEISVMSSDEFLALNRVAFGFFFFEPEAMKGQVERMSKQETALVQWLNSAQQAGALQLLETEIASNQLHSLIKGEAFWPQLLGLQPPLDADARKALAQRTAALFLARYQTESLPD